MKLSLWIIVILVLLSGTMSSLTYLQTRNDKKADTDTPYEVYYFREFFKTSMANESLELDNPLIYKGIAKDKLMNLFDIVNGKCLVFRFSGDACDVCIDFVINKLKTTFGDFSVNDRILLIGSNINDRVKETYYGKEIISFYSEDLGLPFEEYNAPFLFLIDKDRICKMIFIPEKTMPELIDLYLKTIRARCFTEPAKKD